jgi:hypothetical protein
MPPSRAFALVLLAVFPTVMCAQAGAIVGVLSASAGGAPLPYGIVELMGTSRSLFANDSGRFAFRDVQPGRYTLSVRRLGYKPMQLDVSVRAGVTDTVVVRLDRVALHLASVVVKAYPACLSPGEPPPTDTVLAPIVSQLKLNAEQLRFLSKEFPHQYAVEVNKRKMRGDSLFSEELPRLTEWPGKTKSSYKPGAALRRERQEWVFEIPELVEVGDPQFIAAHCWHFGGVHTIDERQHYRVDVVASARLRGVDIDGSFSIDAESFQIRRSVVRLSRKPDLMRGIEDFETTTDYKEILPSIPIIAHVRSVQTVDPRTKLPFSEIIEEHHTFTFRFTGRTPGDAPLTADSIREAVRARKPDRY